MTQVYRSVCRVCHGGCGALLEVTDNRLVRVKPDRESPFNRGRMCVKGLATPEMMYHPSRIRTPLKRTGERGGRHFQPVTWDTALTEIAEKIARIKQETGPESVAIGQGTGRHHFMHVVRFANSLGTPNWYEPGLANCFIPRITACNFIYGGFVSADYYGDTPPRTIIFWGHNPVVTGPDGELGFPVMRALKAGSFGIAVDPRHTETVSRCRMWLPVRPGTDCALALAMLHVIIYENLYDKAFVEKRTEGFEELKRHVEDCTPGWAEGVTAVPQEKITAAARRYALEKPSVIEWGVAVEQTPNCFDTVRAIALLRAVTGNIDIPGGDIFGSHLLKPYPVLKEKLPEAAARKRLGASEFKLLGGFRAVMPSAHVPAVFRAMRYGEPYRIRALLNFGSNPLVTVANSENVYHALLNLDLIVVADMFMTPTAALADYILPAAFWPEVDQIIEIPYVAGNAIMAQQKTVTVEACRPDEEILDDLAARLGLACAGETLKDILDFRLENTGMTFAELKERHCYYPPVSYRKYEAAGRFRTPSGKVEIYSKSLKRMGLGPLPVYREPPESPVSAPELFRRYPLVLTTGGRRPEFFHSEQRQIRSLRNRHPFPAAQINSGDAERYGVFDDDWVYIETARGRIRMKACVTDDIAAGVVNIDHGWWFPEKEAADFGIFEANANILTSDQAPYDPAFGSYQLRGLLCRVQRGEDK